jgi:molybdopterin converting factor subunit 1
MAAVVKVLAFAGARDVIGATELDLELVEAPCSTERFMDVLCARFPALTPFRPVMRIAVNGEYVDADGGVRDGDEVALIPPVAGG